MPHELRTFVGDGKRRYKPVGEAWKIEEPYRAGEKLAEAVNAALFLRRPLLLEGDPGSGKTRLAYAAAWELAWPLHACYVRSTSKSEDLLYDFDQLTRLYDIQASCNAPGKKAPPLKDKSDYLRFQPLGKAVLDALEKIPSVVLIDEIDKADVDFPNDLLQILEEWQFKVKENEDDKIDVLKGRSLADYEDPLPLVIVTSNRERELPAAFLRRCLYFYIEFPDHEKLMEILNAHAEKPKKPLFEAAVSQFMALRDQFRWRKKPGTSELIDWVRLIERKIAAGKLTVETLKTMVISELPSKEALIKTQADRETLARVSAG